MKLDLSFDRIAMIHYQLRCDAAHGFDAWFKNSDTFELQAKAGLVACPECGSTAVNRSLMAPAIRRRGQVVDQAGVEQAPAVAEAPAAAAPTKAAVLPDQVRSMLQKLRAEVEQHCEDVGERFADEARAIHRGESDARGIYGQTTPDQAEALADEGIEIARLPWVQRADG